jgi:tRNA dimethylallyltransferase
LPDASLLESPEVPTIPSIPTKTPVICGPTAGGKSDLAVSLAIALREKHKIPAEIVTADAFQIYTGLDIGTAKLTTQERRGIPHHLIDVVPRAGEVSRCQGVKVSRDNAPEAAPLDTSTPRHLDTFTLDDWLTRANAKIEELRSRKTLPIVVGGTHLYIKALLEGLFEGPEPDHALRAQLTNMDPAERRAELERIDPPAAARIHPNDIRRTVRALEVFRLTGKPISAHQTQWDQPTVSAADSRLPIPDSRFLLIILDWDSEPLNKRINARVKQMMEQGLLEEVRALVESNAFTPQSAEALGYKQLIPLVREAIASNRWPPPPAQLEDAVEKIKIETRRFAKNQRTWLRRLSTTPGAIRLAAPPASDADRDAWIPTILKTLGLPA